MSVKRKHPPTTLHQPKSLKLAKHISILEDAFSDDQIVTHRSRTAPDSDVTSDDERAGNDKSDGSGDEEMEEPKFNSNTTAPERPEKYKAPTTEEVRMIKDASDLFKSNAFKLQIDALIPSVLPKPSRLEPLEKTLFELHRMVSQISPIPLTSPLKGARKLLGKGIAVPYPDPQPTDRTNWKVGFEPPTSIKIVGSWGNKLSVLGKDGIGFEVDLVLDMPLALLQEKDYVNGRFFHKRAFYLSAVAAAIAANDQLSVDLSFVSPEEDVRRTYLLLKPRKSNSQLDFSKSNTSIKILVGSPDPCPFPLSRLSPSHGNIRLALAPQTSTMTSQTKPTAHPASPLYNNLIVHATTSTAHLLFVYNYKNDISSFGDALTLLRVWANQRGYGRGNKRAIRGFDSMGTHAWWAFLLGYLVYGGEPTSVKGKRKTIGRGLSCYQMFRAALDLLAHSDFVNEPVFMRHDSSQKFPPSEFTQHHEAVFVDPSSTFNFLAGVPPTSLELLRHDALMTIRHMDREPESFDGVFMKDYRDTQSRFDGVLRVDVTGAASRHETPLETLEHSSRTNALIYQVSKTVRRALGTRAKHCVVLSSPSNSRALNQSQPTHPSIIEIGIIFDSAQAMRLVDHGPGAEDPDAAAEFRAFWGDKAELRRFNDGRIVESVVWEVSAVEERMQIPLKIVEHILGYHFNVAKENIQVFAPQYDPILMRPPDLARLYSTEPGGYRVAAEAFDALVKSIKGLEDLPLSLVSVSPVTEYLRYTSTFQPTPLNLSRFSSLPTCSQYLPAMDLIFHFEKSAKWPDDLAAIQKVKLAFFETIAQRLLKSEVARHAAVALDADGNVIEDNCSLEIITTSGFAFRGRIYHDREETLLTRIITAQANSPEPEMKRGEAEQALTLHRLRFIHSPRHHAAIAAFHHRCPSFSTTVRLAKRWISAHLLAPHIPEEIVELICAHSYLNPGPADAPGSAPAGFAQTIRLLKDWNFQSTPLFVPLYTATKSEDEQSISLVKFPPDKRLQAELAWKKRVGEVQWSVVTEEDVTGIVFGKISVVMAMRVQQIAAATWSCLNNGMDEGTLIVKAMFSHPLDDYDFVIHLKPAVLPKYSLNVNASPEVWVQSTKYQNIHEESIYGPDPLVDFDPASLFLKDLRKIYQGSVLFFHDTLGGAIIAGLWDPQVLEPRPFRVFGGYSTIPANSLGDNKKPMVELNANAILAEIARLGEGLIEKIVVAS